MFAAKMSSLRRFSLTVALSYVIVILAAALPTALAIRHAATAAERRDRATSDVVLDVARAERLLASAERMASAARAYVLTGNREFAGRAEEAGRSLQVELHALRHQPASPDESAILDRAAVASADYRAAVARVAQMRERGGAPAFDELTARFEREMVPPHRTLVATIEDFATLRREAVGPVNVEAERSFRRAMSLAAGTLLIALLVSAALALAFGRRLAAAYGRERDAIAARDDVVGVVAHDLRSPLAAIAMKAALIQRGTDDPTLARHASAIERIALRMEQMIGTLLDAAGIEAGRFPIRPAPAEIGTILDEVQEVFGGEAGAKSVRLCIHHADDLRIMADRERISQALGNLVANAIKFTPPGGEVEVSAEEGTGCTRFEVRDTGPGIAKGDASHVFDRFWKKEPGGKRGSGLGLYIAKGIIEAHGGRIWVESEPGHGATFAFTLPRAGS